MLSSKTITMRSAAPHVSAVAPYIHSMIECVCAQAHPQFSTSDWARGLTSEMLNHLSEMTLQAVKEIHGQKAREAMELALMAMFAEKHPGLVIAGQQIIKAAGGCAPEDLSPMEALKAVGTFAFILHAEVGRRMGIVSRVPDGMFAVNPTLTYRREPKATNQQIFETGRSTWNGRALIH